MGENSSCLRPSSYCNQNVCFHWDSNSDPSIVQAATSRYTEISRFSLSFFSSSTLDANHCCYIEQFYLLDCNAVRSGTIKPMFRRNKSPPLLRAYSNPGKSSRALQEADGNLLAACRLCSLRSDPEDGGNKFR
jgi:hypothetical protein